jgi:histidine ammonia-lyase
MTIEITGHSLSLQELSRVARDGESVRLGEDARDAMARSRAVVEQVLAAGTPAYGVTTAVGALKRIPRAGPEADAYARRMIRQHRVAQGPPVPRDVVRGTLLLQLNAFAGGLPGVRPLVAERLVEVLNRDQVPPVRSLGSIGQADLAQLAELSGAVFDGIDLAAGEGLALITGNAFATAWAALSLADLERLIDALDVAAALSLEGLGANLSVLHRAVQQTRPHPGLAVSLSTLRRLLDGSAAWDPGSPRNLQDPLSFRNVAHIHGMARDALVHARSVLDVELNASQGNPIVVDEGAVVSVANFEIAGLAAALDYQRIVLATVLGAAAERVVKLLETPWSGLPTGLAGSGDADDAGLAYLGIAVQALAAEARLLAAPVSFELVSTTHAEGIEDRMTMAPLAARRTADMVALGRRVAAVEMAVGAQAVELRGTGRLGAGTAAAHRAIRQIIPFVGPGDAVPDVEPLVEAVERGEFERGEFEPGTGQSPGR